MDIAGLAREERGFSRCDGGNRASPGPAEPRTMCWHCPKIHVENKPLYFCLPSSCHPSCFPYSIPQEMLIATHYSSEHYLACYSYQRGLTSWFAFFSLTLVQIRKEQDGGYETRCRLRECAGKNVIYSFAVNPTLGPQVCFRQQKC